MTAPSMDLDPAAVSAWAALADDAAAALTLGAARLASTAAPDDSASGGAAARVTATGAVRLGESAAALSGWADATRAATAALAGTDAGAASALGGPR